MRGLNITFFLSSGGLNSQPPYRPHCYLAIPELLELILFCEFRPVLGLTNYFIRIVQIFRIDPGKVGVNF